MDVFCYPACAGTGPGGRFYGPGTPYQYYQDQFSSLYAWQTRGASNYNALQVSLRHAMSARISNSTSITCIPSRSMPVRTPSA